MRNRFLLFWMVGLGALLTGTAAGAVALDERPTEPGVWGYRPADGAAVTLNPPPFTWRPDGKARAYRLQVAADAGFAGVVYEVANTPWSAHAPSQAFEPGEYFWRYAGLGEQGEATDWSVTRRFTVGENLPQFAKPPLDELLRRLPTGHPRLFLRPEDVARFKELAQGPLAERWTELRATADRILAKPPDVSEPPKYPEGTERKGEAWKKIWWGNRERGIAAANGAATLAFAHLLSGEKQYEQGAHDLLMALCDWDPKGATNFAYNDEAAMPLVYFPARTYTWLHGSFTPEERARIAAVMTVRGRDCFDRLNKGPHLWKPYDSHANRAWHKLGELAIAFYGEIPEAEQWLDFATTIFYTCYPAWGVGDGGWHEGAAYWNSYLSKFMFWVGVSQAAFNIDPFDKPFFHETGYYGMYTFPPGTEAGAFGDLAPQHTSSRIATLMASLAAGARNPHWQWYADTLEARNPGYLGFIAAAHGGEVTPQAPVDLPTSRAFPDVGLAVLNTNLLDGKDNIQVHFKSDPLGRQSHGYNSNNSLLLNIHGERALICTGRRDIHGSPHHMRWMWESKSDNAILVNGKGQIPHSPGAVGRISLFETSPTLDVVAGEAGDSYDNLDRWTRRILFFKPGVILIHDVLEAPKPSTYQWLLHAPGQFEIRPDAASWKGQPGQVQVQFLHPQGLAISQSGEFDTPPHEWAGFKLDEWHLTAATPDKASRQQFITVITVGKSAVPAQVEKKGEEEYAVRLGLAEGETTVSLHPDHFRIQGADLEKSF